MVRGRIILMAVFALQAFGLGSFCACATLGLSTCHEQTAPQSQCCHVPQPSASLVAAPCCNSEPQLQPASVVSAELLLNLLRGFVAVPVSLLLPDPQPVVTWQSDCVPQLKPCGAHLASPRLRAPPVSERV